MLSLLCIDQGGELCLQIRPCLESAVQSLDLAADFISFELVVEHFPGVQEPWLRLEKSHDPAEKLGKGLLFCSEESFYRSGPATNTVFPKMEVWDQAPAPRDLPAFDPAVFSESQANGFLHHELLLARDLVRGEIVPTAIPSDMVEAFSSAWAVGIDGRLSRLGLPGYTLGQRRSRFSRLFSCAGVLLPDHWQIFQSLWEGKVSHWQEVLKSIRLLPRL